MKRILLFGPDGQVGWELQRSLAPLGAVQPVCQAQVDFEKADTLRHCVRQSRPDVIVNAAAYTAVDKAEAEPDVAMRVNGDALGILAEEANRSGAVLVHYSTDYVFDGSKTDAYTEEDEPCPLSVYGRTKLAGERAIQASGCKHLIFRTSWVYGMQGNNFAKTIVRLAKERDQLKVVDDQVGAPTSAELLADVTAMCLGFLAHCPEHDASRTYGLYHVTPSGYTSWHAYAKFLLETVAERGVSLKVSPDRIYPIPSSEYPSPARRPANSRLATEKLKSAFGLDMPHWKTHLQRFVIELVTAEHS